MKRIAGLLCAAGMAMSMTGCKISYNVDVFKTDAGLLTPTFYNAGGVSVNGVDQGSFVRYRVPAKSTFHVNFTPASSDYRFSTVTCRGASGVKPCDGTITEALQIEASPVVSTEHQFTAVVGSGQGQVRFAANEFPTAKNYAERELRGSDLAVTACDSSVTVECARFRYPEGYYSVESVVDDEILVRAIPNSGFVLERWSDNCKADSRFKNICRIEKYDVSEVVAYFRPIASGEQLALTEIGIRDRNLAYGMFHAPEFIDEGKIKWLPIGHELFRVSDLSQVGDLWNTVRDLNLTLKLWPGDGTNLSHLGQLANLKSLEIRAFSSEQWANTILAEKGPEFDFATLPVMGSVERFVVSNRSSSTAFLNADLSALPNLKTLVWNPNMHTSLADKPASLSGVAYGLKSVNLIGSNIPASIQSALVNTMVEDISVHEAGTEASPLGGFHWTFVKTRDVSELAGLKWKTLSLDPDQETIKMLASSRSASETWKIYAKTVYGAETNPDLSLLSLIPDHLVVGQLSPNDEIGVEATGR